MISGSCACVLKYKNIFNLQKRGPEKVTSSSSSLINCVCTRRTLSKWILLRLLFQDSSGQIDSRSGIQKDENWIDKTGFLLLFWYKEQSKNGIYFLAWDLFLYCRAAKINPFPQSPAIKCYLPVYRWSMAERAGWAGSASWELIIHDVGACSVRDWRMPSDCCWNVGANPRSSAAVGVHDGIDLFHSVKERLLHLSYCSLSLSLSLFNWCSLRFDNFIIRPPRSTSFSDENEKLRYTWRNGAVVQPF